MIYCHPACLHICSMPLQPTPRAQTQTELACRAEAAVRPRRMQRSKPGSERVALRLVRLFTPGTACTERTKRTEERSTIGPTTMLTRQTPSRSARRSWKICGRSVWVRSGSRECWVIASHIGTIAVPYKMLWIAAREKHANVVTAAVTIMPSKTAEILCRIFMSRY